MNEFSPAPQTVIPFSSLKDYAELPPGTLIEGVLPRILWTTQDWIEVKKVQAALNRDHDVEDRYPTRGYLHEHKGKRILVLGDGNTKAIVAWTRGQTVEFTVEGKLPEGISCSPLSRLKSRYHDLFRDFEYR